MNIMVNIAFNIKNGQALTGRYQERRGEIDKG